MFFDHMCLTLFEGSCAILKAFWVHLDGVGLHNRSRSWKVVMHANLRFTRGKRKFAWVSAMYKGTQKLPKTFQSDINDQGMFFVYCWYLFGSFLVSILEIFWDHIATKKRSKIVHRKRSQQDEAKTTHYVHGGSLVNSSWAQAGRKPDAGRTQAGRKEGSCMGWASREWTKFILSDQY